MIQIDHIDHLVLTVRDIAATCAFYERALGARAVTFGAGRTALVMGAQKINLHQAGQEFAPKAAAPTPGSADFCLIAATPLAEVLGHLQACGVPVEQGPVRRTGARAPLDSVYIRDPDGNLVEIAQEIA